MEQMICDICGKPLLKSELSLKYRIRKRVWTSIFKAKWYGLDAHSHCMKELIEIIRKKQENEEG